MNIEQPSVAAQSPQFHQIGFGFSSVAGLVSGAAPRRFINNGFTIKSYGLISDSATNGLCEIFRITGNNTGPSITNGELSLSNSSSNTGLCTNWQTTLSAFDILEFHFISGSPDINWITLNLSLQSS